MSYLYELMEAKRMSREEELEAELDELESDARAARRYAVAGDWKRFRESMASAQLRLEHAEMLAKTAEREDALDVELALEPVPSRWGDEPTGDLEPGCDCGSVAHTGPCEPSERTQDHTATLGRYAW